MSVAPLVAIKLTLSGRVQGIGVRPAIANWARKLGVTGWVANSNRGVEVVAEGPEPIVREFEQELTRILPRAAMVEHQSSAPVPPCEATTFEIRLERDSGPLSTRVPHDLATCEECIQEVLDPDDRRSGYAFTSCTACGPRYSIIESMPYERQQTTMHGFDLCADCRREYEDPIDRRFHAQTNACPKCGPTWWCRNQQGQVLGVRNEAICRAAAAITQGQILALQGLGGYQLAVDATSTAAVERLRVRKQRHGKPLAVMVLSLADVNRLTHCDELERQALVSPAGPIVVLRRREHTEIAPNVAPGQNTLGVMLPTTVLHHLVLRQCQRPLVMTSGNREGEPLEFEHAGARSRLATIADIWLEHDRPIHRPIDDSVVRIMAGRPSTLRLARGLAPLPLGIQDCKCILAVGGHQKGAIALSNGQQAILGPHVGDLDSAAARKGWEHLVASLLELYGGTDLSLVGDDHPDYASRRWMAERPEPRRTVQHHHAHVVVGMIEHGWLDRAALGFAFDGTGLGSDGTIWGGEILIASAAEFRRVGHLLPFELPGGDRAILEPWRVAVSLVQRALGNERAALLRLKSGAASQIIPLLGHRRISPMTTSAGRLFDGVAALVSGVEVAEYEGQGPMLLEAICDISDWESYPFPLIRTPLTQIDWRPAVAQILDDLDSGVPASAIAMRFHRGLANAACEFAKGFPDYPIVLSGGCFQNKILVELVAGGLRQQGRIVGTPGAIPVNDGGLAAGQLAIASAQLAK